VHCVHAIWEKTVTGRESWGQWVALSQRRLWLKSKQVVWPSRVRLTRYTPPTCNNPTAQTFITDHGSWWCMHAYQVWNSLSLSTLFGRVNLTFDLLASNVVHIIKHQVGNLPTNFGVSTTFRSRLIDQHLSDASSDLATLNFDRGGYGACRWWGSSCSVCVPSLKFVGLYHHHHHYHQSTCSAPTTLWTQVHSISQTVKKGKTVKRKLAGIKSYAKIMSFELFSKNCRVWCGTDVFRQCVPVPLQKIWCTSGLSISWPGDLDLWPWNWCALLSVGWRVTWPCDLWPQNRFTSYPCDGIPSCQIWAF